ncbi:MAG TPA: hypothetical protein VN106_02195 [Sphingomicrobium sp.]|nr:hypothetical protein [Sphingomicrobium sp.]
MNRSLARFVTPWSYRRALTAERVQALRSRDGDNCTRCRRPIRFDLTDGHDQGPKIEDVVTPAEGEASDIGNQCLCHGRCNAIGADHTREVQERIRRQNEADLLSRSRRRMARTA